MKSTYCKGESKGVCRDFTDGSSVCLCTKGWNVFFATLNSHKWSDTSPRPKSVSETMIEDALEETVQGFQDWYDETKKRKKRKRHRKKHKTQHVHFHVIHNPTPTPTPSPLPSLRGRVGGLGAIRERFSATVEKYTDEEIKEIVAWYESKKKKCTVPIKRFEARKHTAPPKGKKILKPNPIHLMPKHMQTEEKCPCEEEKAEIVKWYENKRKKK